MSASPPRGPAPQEVREYLGVLRARKWTVLRVTAAAVAVAAVFTAFQKPVYQATAQVLVTFTSTSAGSGAKNEALGALNTEKTIVQSPTVAAGVVQELGLRVPASTLDNHLQVDVVSGATVLNIRYSDQSPDTAARIANAFADAYVVFKKDQAQRAVGASTDPLHQAIASVQAQLAKVETTLASASSKGTIQALRNRRVSLASTLVDLQARLAEAELANATSAQVIKEAAVPSAPASPNWPRNVLGALAMGLALGVALAFTGEAVDDRVKSHRQLEEMSGVPTLASIPSAKARHGLGEHGPYLIEGKLEQGPVTEAYRTMAANILHLASQEELHALMVTSAVAGEGKTAAAANLAVALARLDRLICLVDLDFRAPTVHELFGLDNQIGLTTVLSNARPLEAVINGTEIENLFVIPAGPPIADPAELVARFRDGTYLKQLRKVGAFVILDSPPVLDVADSSILAPATDGVVLVVDGELATRREVRDAMEQLRNAGAKIRGTAHREVGTGLAAYYPHEPWKD